MKSAELTAEAVLQSIGTSKAASLGQLHRALGGKGSVPGSVAKKLKELVPNIGELFAANKGDPGEEKKATPKTGKPTKKAKGGKVSKAKMGEDKPTKRLVKHSASNPFRPGGYGILYDILASHPDGMAVDALKRRYMEITGKDADHARYDLCVILSAKDSPTGPRHRSCREGFWIERENDHARLRLS